jgi:hypothetical protein
LPFLSSARDVVRRVAQHPEERAWAIDPAGYYASSFICRLLRPLAIAQLIERHTTIADFSVDPAALDLLHFKAAMEEMLTGDAPLLGHPDVDWSTQSQHLFSDNLRLAAAKLLVTSGDGRERVMDFASFRNAFPDLAMEPALAPLARIFGRCRHNLTENPIFWLRVVGYAYICHRLVDLQGAELGFKTPAFSVTKMLGFVGDEYISSRAAEYTGAFDAVLDESF